MQRCDLARLELALGAVLVLVVPTRLSFRCLYLLATDQLLKTPNSHLLSIPADPELHAGSVRLLVLPSVKAGVNRVIRSIDRRAVADFHFIETVKTGSPLTLPFRRRDVLFDFHDR